MQFLLALTPCALAALLLGCASTDHTAKGVPLVQAWEAWHAQRIRVLTADEGWLTLVGLDWLREGECSVGSSDTCALRYEHATAAEIGSFVVEGDVVRFRAIEGVVTTADGVEVRECALVADDRGAPTVLRNGSLHITLVRRNGALALRVRDNASAVRANFHGIECFPFDASWIVDARVRVPASATSIAITNVSGFVETQPIAALLDCTIAGHACTLTATDAGEGRLFVVFGDASNGASNDSTTYGGGRFLDVAAPIDGRTVIDFNRAINPPCAFTAFATCPMAPEANRLPFAVHAGERRVTAGNSH